VWEDGHYTEANSSFCPAASSYDTEIVALSMALEWLMHNQDKIRKTLRIFIDNKGVIQGGLNMDVHSNQMESLRINLRLLHLLSKTQLEKIYLTYCPSHTGIKGNSRADDMASRTSPTIKGPVILKQHFTEEKRRIMNEKWRVRASTSEYRGRQWLVVRYNKKCYIPKIGSTAKRKRHFIEMADDDMETMARITHGITNHAPTGECNRRFFPEKPTDCPSCEPRTLHSSEHILTCCRYIFSFPSMRFWKNNKNNDKMLKKIIKENSTIFSFEDLPPDVL